MIECSSRVKVGLEIRNRCTARRRSPERIDAAADEGIVLILSLCDGEMIGSSLRAGNERDGRMLRRSVVFELQADFLSVS